MAGATLTAAIMSAEDELVVHIADSPTLIEQVYGLRYQVYCRERGYESSVDGVEIDAFDSHSRYVVLQRRSTGEAIGTARLVLPVPSAPATSLFPMQAVCDSTFFAKLPSGHAAEVSRFAISKERRYLSGGALSLARIMLVRGLVELSRRQGVTQWLGIMEPTFLRLLRSTAIHFEAVGPLVEYHGLRQPAYCGLECMLARMRSELPELWAFVVCVECAPWDREIGSVESRPIVALTQFR